MTSRSHGLGPCVAAHDQLVDFTTAPRPIALGTSDAVAVSSTASRRLLRGSRSLDQHERPTGHLRGEGWLQPLRRCAMPSPRLRSTAALALLALVVSAPVLAATRPTLLPGQSRTAPHAATGTVSVQPANLTQILQCLMGPGVTVSNA